MPQITSIPNASEMPNHALPLSKTNGSPPLFLYDTHGVTRRARLNGVEALRVIPPFAYITENDVITEEDEDFELAEAMEPLETTIAGGSDFESSSASSPSEAASQPEDNEMHADSDSNADQDERYAYSSSGRSSTRESSLSTGEQSYYNSEAQIADTRTPYPPVEMSNISEYQGFDVYSATSSLWSAPLRASLSIGWPHNERSVPVVVYDTLTSFNPHTHEASEYKKSPSPLSSLTPSPPPTYQYMTNFEPKRLSSGLEDWERVSRSTLLSLYTFDTLLKDTKTLSSRLH
jgi:hypothetical protein